MTDVMIGIDPHKSSHTAVAIGLAEERLGELQVRACPSQAEQLLAWAVAWPERAWAVEGAAGLGHLLAQQLVAAISEPVRQRPLTQFELEPGPLLRAQLLPRHRPFGPESLSPAVPPGPVPAPDRPFSDPQAVRDLIDLVAAVEPPGGLQPQPLPPLLSGRIPASLRIPHTPVIRQQPADVTTSDRRALRVQSGYS